MRSSLKNPSHRRTEVSAAAQKPLCDWAALAPSPPGWLAAAVLQQPPGEALDNRSLRRDTGWRQRRSPTFAAPSRRGLPGGPWALVGHALTPPAPPHRRPRHGTEPGPRSGLRCPSGPGSGSERAVQRCLHQFAEHLGGCSGVAAAAARRPPAIGVGGRLGRRPIGCRWRVAAVAEGNSATWQLGNLATRQLETRRVLRRLSRKVPLRQMRRWLQAPWRC
jgi:hypothetical protein